MKPSTRRTLHTWSQIFYSFVGIIGFILIFVSFFGPETFESGVVFTLGALVLTKKDVDG